MYEKLISEFEGILKDNLVSAVKFGTEGEPDNILLVLNKLELNILEKIKPLLIKHRRKNNVVPLFFTKEELYEGADVFPLEFLDIKYPHELLHGEDIINNIKFHKKYIRRQLEFELRSKLIHLRENYIWIKNRNELKALLLSVLPNSMPLFYGLLFLKDAKEIPTRLDPLFKLIEGKYKTDVSALRKIKNLKDKRADEGELRGYVKGLMDFLAKFIKIVDKIKV